MSSNVLNLSPWLVEPGMTESIAKRQDLRMIPICSVSLCLSSEQAASP